MAELGTILPANNDVEALFGELVRRFRLPIVSGQAEFLLSRYKNQGYLDAGALVDAGKKVGLGMETLRLNGGLRLLAGYEHSAEEIVILHLKPAVMVLLERCDENTVVIWDVNLGRRIYNHWELETLFEGIVIQCKNTKTYPKTSPLSLRLK